MEKLVSSSDWSLSARAKSLLTTGGIAEDLRRDEEEVELDFGFTDAEVHFSDPPNETESGGPSAGERAVLNVHMADEPPEIGGTGAASQRGLVNVGVQTEMGGNDVEAAKALTGLRKRSGDVSRLNSASYMFETAAVVDGGLEVALATRSERTSWGEYAIVFNEPKASNLAINAPRDNGKDWRSCNLRIAGKSCKSKGFLSVWRRDASPQYMVTYRSGDRLLKWFDECGWILSPLERNKIAHALNGNIVLTQDYVEIMAINTWRHVWQEDRPPGGPAGPITMTRPQGPEALPSGTVAPAAGPFESNRDRNRRMHAQNGNSTKEERRQAKYERDYKTVVEHRTCPGAPSVGKCGRVFKFYERQRKKMQNGKSAAWDYGFQYCPGCRDAERAKSTGGVESGSESDTSSVAANDKASGDIAAMMGTKRPDSPTPSAKAPIMPMQPAVVVSRKVKAEKEAESDDDAEGATLEVRESTYNMLSKHLLGVVAAECGGPYQTFGAMGHGIRGQGGMPVLMLAGDVPGEVSDSPFYVITSRFANFRGTAAGRPYQRTRDFGFVRLDGAVWKVHDWLFDGGLRGKYTCRHVAAVKESTDELHCFEVWPNTSDDTAPSINFGRFTSDVDTFRWFVGKDTVTMYCNERETSIARNHWMACTRYFVGVDKSSVCAKYVTGYLKANADLDGDTIDCMLNIQSHLHEKKAPLNARMRTGDSAAWNEVAAHVEGTHARCPWWMPEPVWWAMNPYQREWSATGRVYYSIFLIILAATITSWVIDKGGILVCADHLIRRVLGLNVVEVVERGYDFASSAANYTGNKADYLWRSASEPIAEAVNKHFELRTPNRTAMEYVVRGELGNYILWKYAGDLQAGDKMHRAVEARGDLWVMFVRWLASFMTVSGVLHAVLFVLGPIIEEVLKHMRFMVPIILPWFWPSNFFGNIDVFRLVHSSPVVARDFANGRMFDNEGYARLNWDGVAADEMLNRAQDFLWQDWVNRYFWWTRLRDGRPGLKVVRVPFGFTLCCGIVLFEAMQATTATHVVATVLIHFICHWSPLLPAIYFHMMYNLLVYMTGPYLPYASLVMCGKHAVSLIVAAGLRAYFAGASEGRFERVEPMGKHTQFVAASKDDACKQYPLKEGVEADLKIGHERTKGKSHLTRLMSGFAEGASFAANTGNVVHSLYGRVLAAVPDCVRPLDPLTTRLDKVTKKMGSVEPDDAFDWAAKFPKRKRLRYLEAIALLAVVGFAAFDDKVMGGRNHWDKRSCFLKHECNLVQLDKTIEHLGKTYVIACSDPRTIQASEDIVQAAVGPYFTAYGRRASEVFDGSESSMINGWRVCMAFGRTKTDVARIIQEIQQSPDNGVVDCGDDGYIIWGDKVYAVDAKRWDAHVSARLLRIKSRHLSGLGMPAPLVDMLDRLIKRRGSYKGLGVSFKVEGDVASGDPDTLYWNTVLGVVLLLAAVDGARDFDEVSARCTEWGIEYELAAVGTRTEQNANLDFCSCVFMPTADGWTLAPKIGRSLFKLGYTATQANPAELLASKILGLSYDLACYPDVVTVLRQMLLDLPTAVAISESYVPMGKVNPASYDEIDSAIQVRYGVSYGDLLDDLQTCVTRTRLGEMESGDLAVLNACVATDYGKPPIPCPVKPGAVFYKYKRRTPVRRELFLVGWLGLILIGKGAIFEGTSYGKEYPSEGEQQQQQWRPTQWRQEGQPKGEENNWARRQQEGDDQGVGSLFDRWTCSEGGEDDPEGNFCSCWGEIGWDGRPGPREHHGCRRLCFQRHRAHSEHAHAPLNNEVLDFQLRVRHGSDVGRRGGVQCEGACAEPVRGYNLPMDDEDGAPVHQVPVQAADFRIPVEHFGLCGIRPYGHGDLRSSVQRGGAGVHDQAADGGGKPRGVDQALEQHHVRFRVREVGRSGVVEMDAHGWNGSDELHRSGEDGVCNLRIAATAGSEAVAGGDLGTLYCGLHRPNPHERGAAARRRNGTGDHLDQHGGTVRNESGGDRLRLGEAEWIPAGCGGLCTDEEHHVGTGGAEGRLLRVL